MFVYCTDNKLTKQTDAYDDRVKKVACRLENAIFETTGSKMVAETKKEATARAVTS